MTDYRWSEKEYRDHLIKRGWNKDQAKAMAEGGKQIETSPKKSKYKNEVVRDDQGNKIADSRREGKRLKELRILERAGIITGLILQPRFPFKAMPKRGMIRPLVYVKSGKVITYVADFEYYDQAGERIIEDVKGMRTRTYLMKQAMMWAYYGIEIYET